jgi:uncharacterized membrane protein
MVWPGKSSGPSGRGWNDARMDRFISLLLRLGLALSAGLVVAGAVIYLGRHGGQEISYRVFVGEPPFYRRVPGIVGQALHFRGRGLILAGLIVLIATPVARVAFSVLAFLLRRDYLYVAATVIVLGILLFSLIGGGIR